MLEQYHPKTIEPKWQEAWKQNHVFEVETPVDQPKYYILEMFPYPSGTAHMGHVRNYTMGDVIARYKTARGFHVLHPMGWDSFGLPAENAAIKNKTHPAKWTYANIAYMKEQFQRMGWLYDWRREVNTCSPDYYKWEQLFFIKMYKKGLAYRKLSTVNWCPTCNTVLANEQVENNLCWRCENPVTTKELTQWFFKITAYAEELLEAIDALTGWPERVRLMQKHWIGKSAGTQVSFEIEGKTHKGMKISIFTTRIDTICGTSFLSLAPEHPLVPLLIQNHPRKNEIEHFIDKIRKQDKIKRTSEENEKEGIALGINALNPINGEKVPLYIANFVLMDYGTGAVMAVPAHDTRDHAFAKKYKLPIKEVIAPLKDQPSVDLKKQAFVELGILMNSEKFSGLTSQQAFKEIPNFLEEKGSGKKTVQYKLRDWGISRQRYWGAPIPIIHCNQCGMQPVPEKDLPVLLPEDVEFTGEGPSPLAKHSAFLNVLCPKCNAKAQRETDTMDTFVESSWYYLRYCSLPKLQEPFHSEDVKKWLPVDEYVGGIEHATMHLLYFRFYHRVLQDLGFLPKEVAREPVKHLLNQGIVYKDGAKMSKSKGNVVNPDSLIEKYGADTTRVFSMFAAPPEKILEWSDHGVEGAYRFLGRVWRMVYMSLSLIKDIAPFSQNHSEITNTNAKKLRQKTHLTIQKVTSDLDHDFKLNTAISAIMECVNEIYSFKVELNDPVGRSVLRESIETVIHLLNPFAPHLCEELWHVLGYQKLLALEPWKIYDPQAIECETVTIVVQVNGKLRVNLVLPKDISEQQLKTLAAEHPRITDYLKDKKIIKTIIVPQRLVNFVVK